jgi:hypothetical protein
MLRHGPRARVRPSIRRRLRLRGLEDRAVPAALLVNDAGDAGVGVGNAGDLRYVMNLANTNFEADTITFDAALGTATITLALGQLDYTEPSDLTIIGPGANKLTVSGNGASRIFNFNAAGGNPTISVSGLTLANGFATGNGGAILANNDPLVLTGLVFDSNQASGATANGGAIHVGSSNNVTLTNSTFTNNTAGNNGGVLNTGSALDLTVTGGSFSGNNAGFLGGAINTSSTATISLNSSTFTNNSSGTTSGSGGAVNSSGTTTLAIDGSTFTNNTTVGTSGSGAGGGAVNSSGVTTLTITKSAFVGNTVTGNFSGGGLHVGSSPSASISDTTFINNKVGAAGGGLRFSSSSTVTLDRVLVSGNQASGSNSSSGGGMELTLGGSLTINDSAFVNNTATGTTSGGGSGGAIMTSSAALTITNSTFSGNAAVSNFSTSTTPGGGAIRVSSLGTIGAIAITNSTFTNNSATNSPAAATVKGGALLINSTSATAPSITIESTIIAGNTNASARDIFIAQATGPVLRDVTANNNIIGAYDAAQFNLVGVGNQTGTQASPLNPGLFALANNGGPTPTHGLWYNSPAIDAGANPLGLPNDQRGTGFPRSVGASPDVGAFEGFLTAPFVSATAGIVDVTTAGGTTYTFTVTYDDETGIDTSKLGTGDVVVTGPGGLSLTPTFTGFTSGGGNKVVATYQFTPPGGSWDALDGGDYSISLAANEVFETGASPQSIPAQLLGDFNVAIVGTLVVDSPGDVDDGKHGPGELTLREAIRLANNTVGGLDTITFAAALNGLTITLAGTHLVITDPVTIQGPGADKLTVSGGGASRIFTFAIPLAGAESKMSGLTLTQGSATTGGAIFMEDDALSLTGMVLTANAATAGAGGAVALAKATLTVTDSTLSNNTASANGGAIAATSTSGGAVVLVRARVTGNTSGASGGGLAMPTSGASATLAVTDSTFSGNTAATNAGAINMTVSSADITGSTFSGNAAGATGTGNGGGVIFMNTGTLNLTNSTLSGNTTGAIGGGIRIGNDGIINLFNSTVTKNSAGIHGGGIGATGTTGASQPFITLKSSILAQNSATTADPDLGTSLTGSSTATLTVTAENSIIGEVGNAKITVNATNSLVGTPGSPVDAKLATLANNGGLTETHALLAGSPAINAGANPLGLVNDQRGAGFARVAGGQADIGAFEVQAAAAPPTVTGVQVNDGSPQRSRVTSLKVTFSEAVTFPGGINAAFQLNRLGPGGPTGTVNLSAVQAGNTVTITFLDGGAVPTEGAGSLIDGVYQLTIVAANVLGAGGNLDGDGNGTGGDNFQTPATGPGRLFRLFGDADGDGDVDAQDFGAFRAAFGGTSNLAFDFDGDGDVDAQDFGQFRARFGSSV